MDKRVLLIGETVGFMMNAIINGLKKEEYEVEEVTAAGVAGSVVKRRISGFSGRPGS